MPTLLYPYYFYSMKYFFSFALLGILFMACQRVDMYEHFTSFKDHSWKSSEKPSFSFDITDTVPLYNFSLVLRNEDAYSYKNIWLDILIKAPDTSFTIRKEFTLADNKKWFGVAMDDIIEHRIPFNQTHLRKGKYDFTLTQVMREDPLPHILAAGIRVQKIH